MASVVKRGSQHDTPHRTLKRRKIDSDKNATSQPVSGLRTRTLDALPWTEVPLLDKLDDAEGFLGLEEIEGVEVVKDGSLGKLGFRLADAQLKQTFPRSIPDRVRTEKTKLYEKHVDEHKQDEEWEGLDPPGVEKEELQHIMNLNTTEPSSKHTRKKPLNTRNKGSQGEQGEPTRSYKSNVNTFQLLDNALGQEADVSAWESLMLSSHTVSSLARLKFISPTPIQAAAIPEILNGHDLVGKAVTGSGKTLAFGIPVLEHYLKTRNKVEVEAKHAEEHMYPPIALILSPTRELAHQLSTHLTDLCSTPLFKGPSIATLTGGLSSHKQHRLLKNADIIIGTPGRLWEIMNGENKLMRWLRNVKFLIVDEADRLLSEGHFEEVEQILNALDREDETHKDDHDDRGEGNIQKELRQTLVFSATFQKDLQQRLAGKGRSFGGDLMDKQESMEYLLRKLRFREGKPKFIDANPISHMASRLQEGIVECAGLEKDLYLYALLLHHPKKRTLIFTNSITSVRRITPFLQNLNIAAHALHSQMPQKARLRSIERFSSSTRPSSILVATDVAARGLDIPLVQIVIHYHLPRAADMYVHRSGRTARAANSGSSILLCAPDEVVGVRRLIAKVHTRNSCLETDDKDRSFMRTIELDRRVVARLKPRVSLSKKITDASLAKEKMGHEENWLRTAAEDLGVDYDSEEFAAGEGSKKGRGQGRKKAEKEARSLTKEETGALRAKLKQMLVQRVNIGVSERYLTAGGIDIDELLTGNKSSEFLGTMDQHLGIL